MIKKEFLEEGSWIKCSERMPDLGEYVEVYYPYTIYSRMNTDLMARIKIKGIKGRIWITDTYSTGEDFIGKDFPIEYWRPLRIFPNGRKPYVKICYEHNCYDPKIVWKKVKR